MSLLFRGLALLYNKNDCTILYITFSRIFGTVLLAMCILRFQPKIPSVAFARHSVRIEDDILAAEMNFN